MRGKDSCRKGVTMELSPLARQKLEQAGELTPEEKERYKRSRQLSSTLAEYFSGKHSPEALWQMMKENKEAGKGYFIVEAQNKLADAITLTGSSNDFELPRRGILALETLKDDSKYSSLEAMLANIEKLKHDYQSIMESNLDTIRQRAKTQVEAAAAQMARQGQGRTVDLEGSVEASAKSSPEWMRFIINHDLVFNQKFEESLAKLRAEF